MEQFMSEDGRYHCPFCGASTQLPNKFERHLQKKHGVNNEDMVRVLIELDTAAPDEEE